MYFLKLFHPTLFVSKVGAPDVNREIWLKNIVNKSRKLKQEIDKVHGRFSERCDFKPSTDRLFKDIELSNIEDEIKRDMKPENEDSVAKEKTVELPEQTNQQVQASKFLNHINDKP
jgi:hypothetical protein